MLPSSTTARLWRVAIDQMAKHTACVHQVVQGVALQGKPAMMGLFHTVVPCWWHFWFAWCPHWHQWCDATRQLVINTSNGSRASVSSCFAGQCGTHCSNWHSAVKSLQILEHSMEIAKNVHFLWFAANPSKFCKFCKLSANSPWELANPPSAVHCQQIVHPTYINIIRCQQTMLMVANKFGRLQLY